MPGTKKKTRKKERKGREEERKKGRKEGRKGKKEKGSPFQEPGYRNLSFMDRVSIRLMFVILVIRGTGGGGHLGGAH